MESNVGLVPNSWRNAIGFLLLGTLNNLAYVVVGSAAKSLAQELNGQIGFITFANVGAGLFVRSANTFLLKRVPYGVRLSLNGFAMLCGLVGVSFATHVNFTFCVSAVVLVGLGSSFGESVLLGFLRMYDPECVGMWSSGTGFAGVIGSLLYLAMVAVDLSNTQIFLLLIPSVLMYLFVYFVLVKHPSKEQLRTMSDSGNTDTVVDENSSLIQNNDQIPAVVEATDEAVVECENAVTIEIDDNEMKCMSEEEVAKLTGFGRVRLAFRLTLNMFCQLGLVYFFEYVIQTVGAEHVNTKEDDESSDFVKKNSYVILSFCYQIGVLLSRSSLKFFKVKRVEIMTIIQGMFFFIWLYNAQIHFFTQESAFACMFCVGLLGGCSYVNIFHRICVDKRIPESLRELAINLVAIGITVGIMCAGVFAVLMDTTWASDE